MPRDKVATMRQPGLRDEGLAPGTTTTDKHTAPRSMTTATPSATLGKLSTRGRWRALGGRHGDLVLAALLVVIVALFVLPLPTSLLDLLIATNLAISLVLLIVAMYVPSALSLSTFPSLLLFTTLFRLALNIASTKLILLNANAGHIIDTFGKLIVGNNVVVGGVVFLIIAIVQFIVIAKGSERVAEVAARFALDAMPGKQMSIDADVRAGTLSTAEAQRRRQMLEQECSLHGAMDGAMKFVKGDAIASIVIALVNILAGIAIGTLMKDMSVGHALQRYAILTVGDGMVSQIPSLLVSVAAGIVITRVGGGGGAADPQPTQLAQQIGTQILAHPRALIIAGLAIGSFMIVPGFPKWAFGGLALLAIGAGVLVLRARKRRPTASWISYRMGVDGQVVDQPDAVAAPLAVRLSPQLREALDRFALDQQMAAIKTGVESELGPVFPRLQVGQDKTLDNGDYEILIQDVPVSRGRTRPGWWLLDPHAASNAQGEPAVPFGPFARVVWVESPPADGAGLSAEEVIGRHVDQEVRRHVDRFIGLQQVQHMLHVVQVDAPELAAEVARLVPAQRIGEVLRRLLIEGVPVRNLHAIFESLVQWGPKEADDIALTELVRIDLGRYITHRYAGPERKIAAILFETSLLDRVVQAVDRSPRGNLLLLSPAVSQDVREQVCRLLGTGAGKVVAVASAETRRYLKLLMQPVAPQLVVLSYQEIEQDVALQPVGWVKNPAAA
jgi:type III secretion protein V